MPKTKEVKVLYDNDNEDFEKQINDLLKKGWTLLPETYQSRIARGQYSTSHMYSVLMTK